MPHKRKPPKPDSIYTYKCANGSLLLDRVRHNIDYYVELVSCPETPYVFKRRVKNCLTYLKKEGDLRALSIPEQKLKVHRQSFLPVS